VLDVDQQHVRAPAIRRVGVPELSLDPGREGAGTKKRKPHSRFRWHRNWSIRIGELNVRDIGTWLDRCQSADEGFAKAHPLGFLLYSVQHGPLIPVDTSAGDTLNRALLPNSGNQASVTPGSMFKVFDLGEGSECSVGSDDGCDVVINDESVSSSHARFTLKDDGAHLTDLGSTLGTQVQGNTLNEGEDRPLTSGDSVTLGSVQLRYLSAEKFAVFVTGLLG
jgi:hypothetical protein